MAKTAEEILTEVNDVFIQVFNDASIRVNAGTTAKDIQGWDSLNHTVLIAKVQERFKVKFSLREVMKFQNVGDMCALIRTKLGG